jgi:hypothetical protein
MKARLWLEDQEKMQKIRDRDITFCLDDPFFGISVSEINSLGEKIKPHIFIWDDEDDIFYGTAAQFKEWLEKLPKEINED